MVMAFDFETYMISESEGFAPRPVCLSFADDSGNKGVMLANEVTKFLTARPLDELWVAHNLAFEFSVIYKHYPELRTLLWEKLDQGLLHCTMISAQWLDIQKYKPTNKFSLADLVLNHFGVDLSGDKKNPDSWRTRYSELDGIPLELWPQEAYDYSLADSEWALKLYPLYKSTHLPTVQAACVLGIASDRGFIVRKDYLENLMTETEEAMEPLRNWLLMEDLAYYDKKGAFRKRAKVFREKLSESLSEEQLQYTEKADKDGNKKIAINRKALTSYFVDEAEVWLEFSKLEKKMTAFLKPISKAASVVRTSYNALVSTGRMSARGSTLLPSINGQQIPREGGVREIFQPPVGYRMVSIDYASLELVSTAHQLYNIYGKSTMLDVINSGDKPVDLHSYTAAAIMSSDKGRNISYEEFVSRKKEKEFSHYRQLGKVCNLSFPGGIGVKTVIVQAKDTYGVDLSFKQARDLKEGFLNTYPELRQFLTKDIEQLKTGQHVVIQNPKDKDKPLYLDEYYYRVAGDDFKRRGLLYSAVANGLLMQTPAAFGAKKALYKLGTIGCPGIVLVGFIHDEALFYIKDDQSFEVNIDKAAEAMIDGMHQQFPHARVTVESDWGPYWSKSHGNEKLHWKDKLK